MTGTDTTEPGPVRRSLGRTWVLLVIASFVGIWGYVLYLSVFVGRAEPRDRLDDTTWTAAAETTCAATRGKLADLPFANEASDASGRANLLDAASDELDEMVDRLDGLVPPRFEDEEEATRAWLADWRTYISDRRAYAQDFRAGLDRPFRVTDRGGSQIDVLLDDFAHVNYMESCETPDDVG